MNLLLLMPAARHENAGLFTQALPFVVLALTIALFYSGMKQRNAARK